MQTALYRRAWLGHGVAAAVEHSAVLGALRLSTVVDVGANRGQFALFALHTFPEARIFSFEPLRVPANRFIRALGDQRRITLHRSALGPDNETAVMHVSGHDDSSSLLPITATQSEIFRGTGEVGTEPVKVTRLTELISSSSIVAPALLKMDVQGYELQALRGCEDLLDRFQYACVEASFVELYEGQALADSVIVWLHDHGFRLTCVYGMQSDASERAVQADMLFERTE